MPTEPQKTAPRFDWMSGLSNVFRHRTLSGGKRTLKQSHPTGLSSATLVKGKKKARLTTAV